MGLNIVFDYIDDLTVGAALVGFCRHFLEKTALLGGQLNIPRVVSYLAADLVEVVLLLRGQGRTAHVVEVEDHHAQRLGYVGSLAGFFVDHFLAEAVREGFVKIQFHILYFLRLMFHWLPFPRELMLDPCAVISHVVICPLYFPVVDQAHGIAAALDGQGV